MLKFVLQKVLYGLIPTDAMKGKSQFYRDLLTSAVDAAYRTSWRSISFPMPRCTAKPASGAKFGYRHVRLPALAAGSSGISTSGDRLPPVSVFTIGGQQAQSWKVLKLGKVFVVHSLRHTSELAGARGGAKKRTEFFRKGRIARYPL